MPTSVYKQQILNRTLFYRITKRLSKRYTSNKVRYGKCAEELHHPKFTFQPDARFHGSGPGIDRT